MIARDDFYVEAGVCGSCGVDPCPDGGICANCAACPSVVDSEVVELVEVQCVS